MGRLPKRSLVASLDQVAPYRTRIPDQAHVYAGDPRSIGSLPLAALAERRRTIRTEGEIILAAGAFNSPQLLMLSGVGPRSHLAAHKIPLVADRPGVGANLQDRYEVGVRQPCAIAVSLAARLQDAAARCGRSAGSLLGRVARQSRNRLWNEWRGDRHRPALAAATHRARPLYLRLSRRVPRLLPRLVSRRRAKGPFHLGDPEGTHEQHGSPAEHRSSRYARHRLPLFRRKER
jgi:choline dehydrogenase-like flavoprotein